MGVCRAHPRSRGENSRSPRTSPDRVGSSPLTRGKRTYSADGSAFGGLIPAHAGKTVAFGATLDPDRAHPRSRGENHRIPAWPGRPEGSSPLTRGKRKGLSCRRDRERLIPAHAGKTVQGPGKPHKWRAHPRSRGENLARRLVFLRCWGSSPLTRGKPRRRGCSPHSRGLIPAHAGKTGWGARG